MFDCTAYKADGEAGRETQSAVAAQCLFAGQHLCHHLLQSHMCTLPEAGTEYNKADSYNSMKQARVNVWHTLSGRVHSCDSRCEFTGKAHHFQLLALA